MDSAMSENKWWKIIGRKQRASATVNDRRKGAINIRMSPPCMGSEQVNE